jgi:hypothetical protein
MEDMIDPYDVQISRKDTGEVVFDQTVPNTESMVELTLSGIGKVTYVVKVNGIWFSEQEVDFDTP